MSLRILPWTAFLTDTKHGIMISGGELMGDKPEDNIDVSVPLSIALSPSGSPYLYADSINQEFVSSPLEKKIYQLFFSEPQSSKVEIGLLRLGIISSSIPLPQSIAFWK